MIYNFVPADKISLGLFCFLCVAMVWLILLGVKKSTDQVRDFSFTFFGFLLSFSGVVLSGAPLTRLIPVGPGLFLSVFLFSGVFALSGIGRKVSETFTLATLIGLQGFRLPLELILHHWANLGTVPATMTWTGQNWDVVTGLVSLISIPFLNRNRKLAWVIQILGFGLLLNVLRVVVMSSPFPFSWPLENPILLIGYMPYALIGPLFVGFAFSLHLITFRALLRK